MQTHHTSPQSYTRFTTALLAIIGIGWLLFIGRDLLIPLILAIIIWYLLDSLSKGLSTLRLGRLKIPHTATLSVSIIIMLMLLLSTLNMVAENATALAKDAPAYQATLNEKINNLINLVAPNLSLNLEKAGELISIPNLVSSVSNALGSTIGTLGLVAIYLLFLLMEQNTFDKKFYALFSNSTRREQALKVRSDIAERIRTYLSIKTLVSILTGVLSYLVLEIIGVNYAVFWGFIIFLLNYIPTIGSLLGVLFPAALSLVQFDTSWQFYTVIGLLGSLQFLVGNVLEPRLMGNSLNLSGLVIMLALALWGSIWGIIGMVLSVPITVMIMIVCAQIPNSRFIAILLSRDGKVD